MSLRMSYHQLISIFHEKSDVIISSAAGTTYGIYQAIETNNYNSTIESFAVDTAAHLLQGIIVAIGTYLAVHYFKKLFHKK